MATKYVLAAGGNWVDDATWSTTSGGSADTVAPTAADDAILDVNSGNVTLTGSPVCRSVDCTGYTGTLTHNSSVTWSIGDAGGGSLTLVSGMTYTTAADSSAINFVSTTTGNNITWGGKTHGNLTFDGVGGEWTLQSAQTGRSNPVNVTINNGSFISNGFSITSGTLISSNTNIRTINIENSTYTFTAGSGGFIAFTISTNLTFLASGSMIQTTNSSGNKTLNSGGKTFNDISIGAGSGVTTVNIAQNIIMNVLTISAPRTILFSINETATVSSFIAEGTAANPITLKSSSAGTKSTLSDSSGTNTVTFCTIQDLAATGGAIWDATNNCTDAGNNTGWDFGGGTGQFSGGKTFGFKKFNGLRFGRVRFG